VNYLRENALSVIVAAAILAAVFLALADALIGGGPL